MKLHVFLITICILLFVNCSEYNDEALWKEVGNMKNDLATLQSKITDMNSDISNLQKLIEALQKEDFVKSIAENSDGSYTIHFSSGKLITIRSGENGKDGKEGRNAPVIGIRKEANVYYWTLTIDGNTSWLTDSEGKRLHVSGLNGKDGENGQDGVTPIVGIDLDGFWTVDYGEGGERIKDSSNYDIKAIGKDGTNGLNGDSFFKGINIDEDAGTVTFSLNDTDCTTLVLPLYNTKRVTFIIREAEGEQLFLAGDNKAYKIESKNVKDVLITKPDGWSVSINVDYTELKIIAPKGFNIIDQEYGTIKIAAFNNEGLTEIVSINVKADLYVPFVDYEFKKELYNKIPLMFKNGEMLRSVAATIYSIVIDYNTSGNVESLGGIEYFTNLEILECSNHKIMSLDLRHNEKLTYLACYKNQLMSVDVSNCLELETLNCMNNNLTSVDVSGNKGLKKFFCDYNRLRKIDIHNNKEMFAFSCTNRTIPLGEKTKIYAWGNFDETKDILTGWDYTDGMVESYNCSRYRVININV